ncbi:hypothetical protein ACU5P1_16980 [Pseudomonas plecoglossicida]|uniref:Uncharacterized protein n=1 Tax=Pseudomonas plecoglossicida TaxID=70775 RepID=A0AAD0QWD5_PSEDL|nr:hypothetical protein [Pseudomonas plecoglossicida]AXM95612.1 hypothetical protein DVB73_07270 [Pseudomonas plecoglossicida]EPB94423.1 hypothetical protein L321_18807 [Pseudomonas plecoglossicida NB2011]QLB56360.1 hypothetical protein HAV28_16810 [Pseudomonas plecoglossicida]GLR38359.1 hypothetical protein GCM10011247_37570 [Pseudomonas plecoglossicida]
MQPHQQVLALGIAWLIGLIALTFIIPRMRHRAFIRGLDEGRQQQRADLKLQIKGLQDDLDEARIQSEAGQRKHHQDVANLKASMLELEARIMSYTGLPVTKADYESLVSALSIMRLAQRTFKALKTEAEAARAGAQADVIDELAKRIHAQLRSTPGSSVTTGAAA